MEDVLTQILNELQSLKQNVQERFDGVDQKFADIDQKFADIDQKFADIDRRFDDLQHILEQQHLENIAADEKLLKHIQNLDDKWNERLDFQQEKIMEHEEEIYKLRKRLHSLRMKVEAGTTDSL